MGIKRKILKFAAKHITIKKMIKRTLIGIRKIKFKKQYYQTKQLDENLVVFEAFAGRSFACNPKALYLRMLELPEWKNKKKIWCFKKPQKYAFLNEYDNTEVVKFRSKAYYKAFTNAKYAVVNSRLPIEIKKNPQQIYLQTWHGTPLKKLGYDIKSYKAKGVTNEVLQKGYDRTIDQCSLFLSPSDYYTEKIISSFNLEARDKTDIILQKGYPRNDYLYNHSNEDVKRIRAELNIPADKKVILYCPTYRDNQSTDGIGHTYGLGLDFDKLKSEISDDYCVLFRTHYFINNVFNFEKHKGFIYDVSAYPDINELYIVSDLLITDYSSVMFDYSILKRPIILYMYDFEEYKNDLRDFYLDLEELPSEAIFTQQQLVAQLISLKDGFKYTERYEKFNERHNSLNGPDTSKAVLDYIASEINKQA